MRSWFPITPLLAFSFLQSSHRVAQCEIQCDKINFVIMKCASVIKRWQLAERSGGRSILKQHHHFSSFAVTDTVDYVSAFYQMWRNCILTDISLNKCLKCFNNDCTVTQFQKLYNHMVLFCSFTLFIFFLFVNMCVYVHVCSQRLVWGFTIDDWVAMKEYESAFIQRVGSLLPVWTH